MTYQPVDLITLNTPHFRLPLLVIHGFMTLTAIGINHMFLLCPALSAIKPQIKINPTEYLSLIKTTNNK